VALFLVATGEVVFLYKVDWYQEVKRAQLRCKLEESHQKSSHLIEQV
jgi:hypothetical protein